MPLICDFTHWCYSGSGWNSVKLFACWMLTRSVGWVHFGKLFHVFQRLELVESRVANLSSADFSLQSCCSIFSNCHRISAPIWMQHFLVHSLSGERAWGVQNDWIGPDLLCVSGLITEHFPECIHLRKNFARAVLGNLGCSLLGCDSRNPFLCRLHSASICNSTSWDNRGSSLFGRKYIL